MPHPTPDEIARFHRWFAIECNNAAWDAAETLNPTDDEAAESMVRDAFAAAWHWQQVGEPINHFRANQLLAWVHGFTGRADGARRYSALCEAAVAAHVPGLNNWDRAFHGLVLALTHAATGDTDATRRALTDADTRAQAVTPAEQSVFARFRQLIPTTDERP